jgi:hypothetical protein
MNQIGPGKVSIHNDFRLAVAAGCVPGWQVVRKLGYRTALPNGNRADIWNYPTEDLYTFSTTAAIDKMSSSNVGDTQEMRISGLDSNWEESCQTKSLNGRNKVTLDPTLIRINAICNANSTPLSGNVYVYEDCSITAGVPDTTANVRAYVKAAEGCDLNGIYTVPSGKTAFAVGISTSAAANVNVDILFSSYSRLFGSVFNLGGLFSLQATGDTAIERKFSAPITVAEKSDLLGCAVAAGAGSAMAGSFELLLADNSVLPN